MINKMFQDLKIGDRFFLDNKEYVKQQDVRVSCCKTVNASTVENSGNTLYVQPTSMVLVNA